MDLDRFSRLLETHGADLARWPEDERHGAGRLLETSAAVRAAWAAAQRLDTLFARDRPTVDDARRHAITTAALRRIRTLPSRDEAPGWRWLFSPVLGATFAAMLVIGCLVGFQTADPRASSAVALNVVFAAPDRGIEGFIQ